MKKKSLGLLFTAALTASLLAGCGSSKGMMNEYAVDTAAPAAAQEAYLYDAGYGEYEYAAEETAVQVEDAMPEEAVPAGENGTVTDGAAEEITEDPRAGRKLITTMDVSAETEYFDDLMVNLERQIAALGGYIESSNQWNGGVDAYGNRMGSRSAYLTIRIPAEKLGSFVSMVEESSNITHKSQSVEDVTLAYVDLESHKKALLTEQERLLELMEMAETVEDLITVEDKLATVRYELESMESQLRTYDNKINYSTVNLDIQEVERLTPAEEPTAWGRIRSGFSENMYEAGQDIENFLIGVIINIPYIVIWLVILAVVLLIVFLLAKHEKKKKAKRELRKVPVGPVAVMPGGAPAEGKLPVPNPVQGAGGKLPMPNPGPQTAERALSEEERRQMEEEMDDTILMSEEEKREYEEWKNKEKERQ